MFARISAFLVAFALVIAGVATAQERYGTLTGAVTDQQGQPVPGVAVTITNTVTGEARTHVTDSTGHYLAADLNPGRYKVDFVLTGFARTERPDISIVLGRTFVLNTQMRLGALTETVQVTAEAAPLIDTRTTLIAHNVPAEEIELLPKGRSFQSIALTAPSVNAGEVEGGFQVNGASGAENSFTIDGIVTNGLIYGNSRQNTVFEYLQEVQVKTSGISAEYGGALGGVISAVTKTGGNVAHGEAHWYFDGSALSAAPVKRLVMNPFDDTKADFTQDKKDPIRNNEFGGSLGGAIVKNKLFFFGLYSPRNENKVSQYSIRPTATEAATARDMERNIWKQQAFGKLTYSTSRYNASFSTLWTPTKSTGALTPYSGTNPNEFIGTVAALEPNVKRGYEINQVNTSGTLDIALNNTSFLRARGGIFRDRYSDTDIPNVTSYAYQTATTTLNAILPPSVQGGINVAGVNTPRALITDFDTTKRQSFDIGYNHVVNAGGLHTFKAGYGFQHVANDINSFYPGGYVNIFWDRSFSFGGSTPARGTYGYYEVNDRRIQNKAGSDINSLYAQDQWTVSNRLTLDVGLRAEHEAVPTFRPDYQKNAFVFGWGDKLAPRLGAAYDVFGDGRAKAFASWGRYFDWTKYELVRGSFGAETWCIYYRGLDTLDLGSLNLDNKPGRDVWAPNPGACRDRRVPSFASSIEPDMKPMSQDSLSGGVDYQLDRNSTVTVHVIHNKLNQTIEDLGFLNAQGNEGYLIGNPGIGKATTQFPSGKTPLGHPIPKPQRKYDALELGYSRRYADNWFWSANYTLSRLWGNYPGIGSSDEITPPTTGQTSATAQQQTGSIARIGSNASRAWDTDELLWDAHGHLDNLGRLATDRPQVVKLYGAYRAKFGTQIGAFLYAGSGTPLTTNVLSTNTSGGVGSFVEGRGNWYELDGSVTKGKRTPMYSRTDLLVSHELALQGEKKLRFELNVLNLFNQKTVRYIYSALNRGLGAGGVRTSAAIDLSGTDLTKGYDYNALILKSPEGKGAYDPRYGMDALFEPGTQGQFLIKYSF